MLVRRMIEIAKIEDLATFQEQRVLRTVPVGFKSGPFDQTTEKGRDAICSRLKDAVQSSVLASYDGATPTPEVLAFFADIECTVDGVENLGSIVGTMPFRRMHINRASKVFVSELETARNIHDVGAQTLGSLFAYSLQQGFQHHLKAQPAAVLMPALKAVDEAGYRFIASLTDYNHTETPGGPKDLQDNTRTPRGFHEP